MAHRSPITRVRSLFGRVGKRAEPEPVVVEDAVEEPEVFIPEGPRPELLECDDVLALPKEQQNLALLQQLCPWIRNDQCVIIPDEGANIDPWHLYVTAFAMACVNRDVERRVSLFLIDCAAHVLPIREQSYPDETWPRAIISACRDMALGNGSEWARRQARERQPDNGSSNVAASFAASAASACDWDAGITREKYWREAGWPPRHESLSAEFNSAWADWESGWRARDAIEAANKVLDCAQRAMGFYYMYRAGADPMENDAHARNSEKQWQVSRLITWLSDDEPEPWPLPSREEVAA